MSTSSKAVGDAPARAASGDDVVGVGEHASWRQFVGRLSDRQPLREVILASWQRSAAAGLSRDASLSFRHVGDAALQASLAANRELVEVAKPHLDWVSTFMAGVEHVVYLTDRSGVVLYAVGDLAHGEAMSLRPGFDWSERTMGTNGAGTALAADRPIAVIGSEHYASAFENCTCTAAPVHRDGKVIGAIDISTSVEDATPDRIALVAHVAFVIERELSLSIEAQQQELYRKMTEELRARERELLTTNAELQALLDNTTAVIYLVDLDARLLRINRRWEDLFGIADAQAAGRSLYELFPADMVERFVQNNRCVVEGRRPMEFEEEALVDGERRMYLSVKVPLFDSSGAPYAICGISTDITERKAAEQRERQILREASARKQRFIAALAHELRSPLSAIMSAAQVLELGAAGPVPIETASGIILRQASHIASLVEQVLEASRVATHRLTLSKAVLDVQSVLERAVEAVRPAIDARDQRLDVSLPADRIPVDGDATRLTQVFVNLLDNASRYSARGQRISLAASSSNGQARVVVRDEGSGIPPEFLPRIFELLFQAHSERGAEGLGIGLALVKGIVEAHGGSVSVRSDGVGRGSEFVVTLPTLPAARM